MKIAVIGGGAMGSSLIRGWLAQGMAAENLAASDPSPQRRRAVEELGIAAFENNREAVEGSEIVVLAVKPQIAKTVLAELKGTAGKRLFSIVAGLTTSTIEEYCQLPVVRAMPNNPCQVGAGAIAICPGKFAQEEDLALAEELFSAVGKVVRVQEDQMDAVTGLSGSGPAFIYLVAEALSDGGVLAGLPRQVATDLAVQTLLGAALTLEKTGSHPAVLKEEVTSPAGTTIEGLAVLEKNGVRSAFIQAVSAASRRSAALGGTKERRN